MAGEDEKLFVQAEDRSQGLAVAQQSPMSARDRGAEGTGEMNGIFRTVSSREWKNDAHTIWELTRQHLPRLIIAGICSLILSGINGAIAWLVKPSLDGLFVEKNRNLLLLLPLGIFLLFALRGFFTFCNNFLMSSIGAKIVKYLRETVYGKLLRLPMSFYSQKSGGTIISRLINDIGSIENLIANLAKDFFVESSTAVVLTGVALYRRWDLALLSFTVIPLVIITADRFGKRMKKTAARTRKLISAVTSIIHETLSGMRIIKSFTMEPAMNLRNSEAVAEHYRNVMREVRINEVTDAIMEAIAGAGVAAMIWYGSYLILSGKLSVGSFFSFVAAILMIYQPLKRLSKLNNSFQMVRAALHRIREILLIEDEKGGTVAKADIRGQVRYEGVTFSYPESKEPALKDVSLDILPGETVALVGYSGAGKSTLTDLLLGFWQAEKGTIFVDGTEIKEYALKSIRSHIGVVSQDIILFDDSVRNNILFGNPGASEEEIIAAAKAAYAHEFIAGMPAGYDTQIGERGTKLSGGQKQRISLARAIIRNPKILILDEATSSLDTDSEMKIQKALESILPGRTTIVIAHRLSTIKKANRIIVMDRGRIIQQGRHDELSASTGIYKQLYDMQFGAMER
jgi:subfamily B ATP-binding cassette protein MsbA